MTLQCHRISGNEPKRCKNQQHLLYCIAAKVSPRAFCFRNSDCVLYIMYDNIKFVGDAVVKVISLTMWYEDVMVTYIKMWCCGENVIINHCSGHRFE